MVQLRQLLHLDDGEFPALREQIEAAPLPRVGVRTPRPPLPLGAPARSVATMAELRAADRTLGIRRPATPKQRPANPFAWQTATAALVHTLAVAYDDIADELETALAELAELAPFTAKAGC
jgi:hypothetical protein